MLVACGTAFGPDWKTTYKPGPQGGVVCSLSIKWQGEWRAREGGAENTQIEAVKGGLSDAEKRAATEWGIGRHLYDLGSTWVKLQDRADYSVSEGRRIYMKGKHAVAPSIRKLQPDLFYEKKNQEIKPVPKEQVAGKWNDVKTKGRDAFFYNECLAMDVEPELAEYMVCKAGKVSDISSLSAEKIKSAMQWIDCMEDKEFRKWKADFLGEAS